MLPGNKNTPLSSTSRWQNISTPSEPL